MECKININRELRYAIILLVRYVKSDPSQLLNTDSAILASCEYTVVSVRSIFLLLWYVLPSFDDLTSNYKLISLVHDDGLKIQYYKYFITIFFGRQFSNATEHIHIQYICSPIIKYIILT